MGAGVSRLLLRQTAKALLPPGWYGEQCRQTPLAGWSGKRGWQATRPHFFVRLTQVKTRCRGGFSSFLTHHGSNLAGRPGSRKSATFPTLGIFWSNSVGRVSAFQADCRGFEPRLQFSSRCNTGIRLLDLITSRTSSENGAWRSTRRIDGVVGAELKNPLLGQGNIGPSPLRSGALLPSKVLEPEASGINNGDCNPSAFFSILLGLEGVTPFYRQSKPSPLAGRAQKSLPLFDDSVAQSVEHRFYIARVGGSSPSTVTTAHIAQVDRASDS